MPAEAEVTQTIKIRGPLTVGKIRAFVKLTEGAPLETAVSVTESKHWPGEGTSPSTISASFPFDESVEVP